MSDRYYYKDFITGKMKFTRGEFRGWTEKQGPLNARYAKFCNPKGIVLVPEYCISKHTKDLLESLAEAKQ